MGPAAAEQREQPGLRAGIRGYLGGRDDRIANGPFGARRRRGPLALAHGTGADR
ncbi:hypothetical protein ACFVT1_22690 [Streptomyces sp. NPDC057963]|uniref:hypothetical protein n=1 Tax=Streptomyces sp. NPDC057963 TaxID=3346290 RepID=UPI0036E99056